MEKCPFIEITRTFSREETALSSRSCSRTPAEGAGCNTAAAGLLAAMSRASRHGTWTPTFINLTARHGMMTRASSFFRPGHVGSNSISCTQTADSLGVPATSCSLFLFLRALNGSERGDNSTRPCITGVG